MEKIHDQRGAEKSEMDDLNKYAVNIRFCFGKQNTYLLLWVLCRKTKKRMKKYEEITEMLKNCEKQSTSLEEEYKQLKKNAKKTAESLKTEEDKVSVCVCVWRFGFMEYDENALGTSISHEN